jgi:Protein of unknown function (DUF5818)
MRLLCAAFVAVLWFAGSGSQVFEGEISDSQCAFNVHSHDSSHNDMIKTNSMGSTPQECALTCVRYRNGKYVLLDPAKKKIYRLEPQDGLDKFAGKKVRVRGSADKDTDLVHITEVKPL